MLYTFCTSSLPCQEYLLDPMFHTTTRACLRTAASLRRVLTTFATAIQNLRLETILLAYMIVKREHGLRADSTWYTRAGQLIVGARSPRVAVQKSVGSLHRFECNLEFRLR